MNEEVKAEWVAALRSGDYPQGAGMLRSATSDGYCCLGVLCELAVKHGVIQPPKKTLWGAYLYAHEFGDESRDSSIPRRVAEWAGLDGPDPVVKAAYLSEWNDVKDADFPQIANMIEEEL